jgi:hypothetical protein
VGGGERIVDWEEVTTAREEREATRRNDGWRSVDAYD